MYQSSQYSSTTQIREGDDAFSQKKGRQYVNQTFEEGGLLSY